jgi:helicase MOV-10
VSILAYPNEQFYKGELEPHGDKIITDSFLRWSELPTPGFPIIFHAITGKDLQEANSPSFFNVDEASLVKRYVEMIRRNQKLRLQDADIGIITPYHAQVMKIRTLLKEKNSPRIKVGSVEEFQGQVRLIEDAGSLLKLNVFSHNRSDVSL